MPKLETRSTPTRPTAPPTARQIYALAAALCERLGETFPENRAAAPRTPRRPRLAADLGDAAASRPCLIRDRTV